MDVDSAGCKRLFAQIAITAAITAAALLLFLMLMNSA